MMDRNFDSTLEENGEMMDLNKSFYILDDLDMDLKQVSEPMFEDAQLDLKKMTLEEGNSNSDGLVIPQFGPASLLADAMDDQCDKNSFKRCMSCGKLKNMRDYRIHEKRCTWKSMDFKYNDKRILY